jgi:hypothetical protein
LKNGAGNHDCNDFLKNFASAAKTVTQVGAQGFCARIQKLGVERRNCSIATQPVSPATTSNHGLREIAHGVFVTSFATPTALLTSAV